MKTQNTTLIKNIIFFVAVVVFIFTAINSHGYYHGDEHYQIIEFCGIKLHTHVPQDLAWEYHEKMRSTLQVLLCYIFLKSSEILSISNPYSQVLILRVITTLLALFTIRRFIKSTESFISQKSLTLPYHLLSYFLWFIPYLNVRFSSETWSSLFFLLALTRYFNSKEKKASFYSFGVFLALSFIFRYQIAIAISGLIVWFILNNKLLLKEYLQIGLSFFIIIILSTCIDSWFYDTITIAPWNYFNVNILQNATSNFGTSPWYYYIAKLVLSPTLIIGIPIVISIFILGRYKPNNIFIWIIIPYISIHMMIPHKEERFLFFVLYFAPIILTLAYQLLLEKRIFPTKPNRFLILFLFFFSIVNLVGLYAVSQKSAGNGKMAITKYIYDHYNNKPINLIHTTGGNPYDPWHSVTAKFYEEKNIKYQYIPTIDSIRSKNLVKNATNLLVVQKKDINKTSLKLLNNLGFKKVKQSIPEWIDKLNNNYRRLYKKNDRTLYLYEYQDCTK